MNGFDISLPVAVCSGAVNSLFQKHGESITMQYEYCTLSDQIDSIKNLLDRFSSSKPLSPPIPKYQISVCLLFSKPDVLMEAGIDIRRCFALARIDLAFESIESSSFRFTFRQDTMVPECALSA
ncbi:hypothetical protein Tco_0417007 [Tanacetum coccineum]